MKLKRRSFLTSLYGSFISSAILPFYAPNRRKLKGFFDERSRLIKKIDIHTHISSDAQYLKEVMDQWNVKMFTICNEGLKSDRLEAQRSAARQISRENPRYYAWCTTFDLSGFEKSGWAERAISGLREDFDNGALGVKVWKEIGMQLQDTEGRFIMIDDPVFDPIFKFIERNNRTLFTHMGDPPAYWLDTNPDGIRDAWYRPGNRVWNRIGNFKGEVSYDTLMLARDRVLARYPGLRIVGCHMGNLGWDLNQMASRLEAYPNYAVETSFTQPLLQGQARSKVRNFFDTFQDRILYGSDISGGLVASPYLVDMSKIDQEWSEGEIRKMKRALIEQYEKDFNYFATDREFSAGNYSVQGLGLSEEILLKIYYNNAVSWIPGINKGF